MYLKNFFAFIIVFSLLMQVFAGLFHIHTHEHSSKVDNNQVLKIEEIKTVINSHHFALNHKQPQQAETESDHCCLSQCCSSYIFSKSTFDFNILISQSYIKSHQIFLHNYQNSIYRPPIV